MKRKIMIVGLILALLGSGAAWLVWPQRKVTEEIAAKIQPGMRLAEVKDILVEPLPDFSMYASIKPPWLFFVDFHVARLPNLSFKQLSEFSPIWLYVRNCLWFSTTYFLLVNIDDHEKSMNS